MPPAADHAVAVNQVTGLIQSSQNLPPGHLALILAILVVLAIIVFLVEAGRIGYWLYDIYRRRRQDTPELAVPKPGGNGHSNGNGNGNGNGAVQAKIEQRVQDIHDNTMLCGSTQRETLALVREFRADTFKSFERISKHIEAHTEAVQANTQVLRSMVEHFEMRPCQLDPAEIAKKMGLGAPKNPPQADTKS